MTAHDTGDWLGCYGHKTVHTPRLDRLAAEGCRFAANFATSPVCTPSRGSMLTGRYPQANGLMGIIQTPYRWRFRPGERHLSHLLAEQGYHTVLFNHQHEAAHDDPLGFREKRLANRGDMELLTGERVSTADETAEAVAAFLRERGDGDAPFYAQAGFFETHTPYDWNGARPDETRGVEVPPYVADTPENRRHIAALQGAIRSLDRAVGQILDALSETGLDRDTIVVFTVDHGVELPHCKWELYDGGLQTALLMRGPEGVIPPGTVCDRLASNVDLVPSLLELAGLPVPDNVQGRSFAGFFRDPQAEPTRDAVFAMMHSHGRWVESRCVRTQRYKLIRNFSPSRTRPTPDASGHSPVRERPVLELYDLGADPSELNDLGRDAGHERLRRELDARLLRWMQEVNDPILDGPIRTPYYAMAMEDLGRGAKGELRTSNTEHRTSKEEAGQ
jgi:arylsulfatase A-like enzyme